MMRLLVAYGVSLVVLLVVDGAYLGTIGAKMFRETLGDVMAPTFSIPPAVLFYLVYPLGILVFAVMPGFETGKWTTALGYGALFGFFCYFTYDMTNWATIRNWTPMLAATDVAWGTFVTGLTATAAFFAGRVMAPG